ncbi:MAG: class I SAM-dependent methyltransferase [Parvibaculaceae bacterium]
MSLRDLWSRAKNAASRLNEGVFPTNAFPEIEQARATLNPNYPSNVRTRANQHTVAAIRQLGVKRIAEFGVLNGDTAIEIAKCLPADGEIHLFDFDYNVTAASERLVASGFTNVRGYGSSTKLLDNYNWELSKLIERHAEPIFDYAFIDGAHTWNVDALTFFLVDRLLEVGGYVDFDDYNWSLAVSPTLAPHKFPGTLEIYTSEQIEDRQVKRVVDLLVRRDPRYTEIVPNRIFRKLA